jgi:hypothetical protein
MIPFYFIAIVINLARSGELHFHLKIKSPRSRLFNDMPRVIILVNGSFGTNAKTYHIPQ